MRQVENKNWSFPKRKLDNGQHPLFSFQFCTFIYRVQNMIMIFKKNDIVFYGYGKLLQK